jgi:peptidoglycan/xylan/chitin deacetylase (PgdA/CDA1 family)
MFVGDEFVDGATAILDVLQKHRAQGSFFLTWHLVRDALPSPLISRIIQDGHYVGPLSYDQPLYQSIKDKKRTLTTRAEFITDSVNNRNELQGFGVRESAMRFVLAPPEGYTQKMADWAKSMGLTLVSGTPGTCSTADSTGEDDNDFISSETILNSITSKEHDPNGLNGYLLVFHMGSSSRRADKFYNHFGELLDSLTAEGYQLVRVDELLGIGRKTEAELR